MSPGELFLAELLASSKERRMMQALQEKPEDEVARAMYVDFLKEEGRKDTAELVEKQRLWTPPPRSIASGAVGSGQVATTMVFSGLISSGAIGGSPWGGWTSG